MILVDQRTESDCLVACLATILRLPYQTVPDFVGLHGGRWYGHLQGWLRERGLEITFFDEHYPRRGLYMVYGFTNRGSPHMTVWSGGDMVHDPHPERAGLVVICHTYWIMATDVGRWVQL